MLDIEYFLWYNLYIRNEIWEIIIMQINRIVTDEIREWLGKEKVLILKGARQVGKTTILNQLQKDLTKANKTNKYFAIDQELNNPLFSDAKLFINFIEEQYSDEFVYIFLDEFQIISNAGLFIKAVFDKLKGKCQLIVSGSSSLEITKNSEFLTGRKVDFQITTLSFREFISYKSEYKFNSIYNIKDVDKIELFHKMYSEELKYQFTEYLKFGGYPEVATTKKIDHKKIIIKELISTYIQKDIAGFQKIGNISGFNNLLKILINQSGNIVNKNELSNALGLSYETINKYIDVLKGTYVIDLISPYFSNIRKEVSKMPKVYSLDFGFNRVLNNYNPITSYDLIPGSIIESFIYLELKKNNNIDEINYYRTVAKAEIDFIIQSENSLIPIEVKFSKKVKKMPVVMKHFNINYKTDKNIIFTKDNLSYNQEANCYFVPAYLIPFINF